MHFHGGFPRFEQRAIYSLIPLFVRAAFEFALFEHVLFID